MKENVATRQLRDQVRATGGDLVVISGNRFSSGYPDRMLYSRRWVGLLEIKVGTNRCSAQQRATIARLRKHDATHCYVLRVLDGMILQVEDEHGCPLSGEITTIRDLLWWLQYSVLSAS